MTIRIEKITNTLMRFLTPEERIELILEFCNQRRLTGKEYSNELILIQSEMPDEQRSKYFRLAMTVITTNRMLFEIVISLKGVFYQTYCGLLLTIIVHETNTTSNKKRENTIDIYLYKLEEIYIALLTIFSTEKIIADQLNLKKIIYPVYSECFRKIEKEISDFLTPLKEIYSNSKNKQTYRPDIEAQELLVKTINEMSSL
jgi:hypothetical protein